MAEIYVTGHKNPDTDSICSAVVYATLKNKLDKENQYIAVRPGKMNAQSKALLKKSNVLPPKLLRTVIPRVSDVAIRDVLTMNINDPIYLAIKELNNRNISLIPMFNDDFSFEGTISHHEISQFFIRENQEGRPEYHFRIENFQKVLRGYFYLRGKETEFNTCITTGAMPYQLTLKRLTNLPHPPIMVIGLREDLIQLAVDEQFPAIILTGMESDKEISVDFSSYKGSLFVSHLDTAETIRLLRLSAPLKDIVNRNPLKIEGDVSFDKAKGTLMNSTRRGMPVFDNERF